MIAGDLSINNKPKTKNTQFNKEQQQQKEGTRIINKNKNDICHMIKKYENELDELNTKCASIDVVLKSLQSFFFVKPKTTEEQLNEVHDELTIAHDDMLIEVRQLYRGVNKLDKSIQSIYNHHHTNIPKSNPINNNKKKITKKKKLNNKNNNKNNNHHYQNINRSTKITNLHQIKTKKQIQQKQILQHHHHQQQQQQQQQYDNNNNELPLSSSLSSLSSVNSYSSSSSTSMNYYNYNFNLSIK